MHFTTREMSSPPWSLPMPNDPKFFDIVRISVSVDHLVSAYLNDNAPPGFGDDPESWEASWSVKNGRVSIEVRGRWNGGDDD